MNTLTRLKHQFDIAAVMCMRRDNYKAVLFIRDRGRLQLALHYATHMYEEFGMEVIRYTTGLITWSNGSSLRIQGPGEVGGQEFNFVVVDEFEKLDAEVVERMRSMQRRKS